MANREKMNQTFRERIVPALRDRGFKGSMPHFRRVIDDTMHLMTIQFRSAGGSFVAEIAKCSAGEHKTSWGKVIPESKMNVGYLPPRSRIRLGAPDGFGDHWFDFAGRPDGCELCANELLAFLESDAEPFWCG